MTDSYVESFEEARQAGNTARGGVKGSGVGKGVGVEEGCATESHSKLRARARRNRPGAR
jgi:hypothetical protein